MRSSTAIVLAGMVCAWACAPTSAYAAAGLTGPTAPTNGPALTRVAVSGAPSRLGLEADLAWLGTPLRAGGLAWNPAFGSGWAGTAWGGLAWPVGAKGQVLALGGSSRYVQGGIGCPGMGGCGPFGTWGAFAAVAYRHQEEFLWLQVTPQLFTYLDGPAAYPTWALSGLPWVEMGVVLAPGVEVSFRLGETLASVVLRP